MSWNHLLDFRVLPRLIAGSQAAKPTLCLRRLPFCESGGQAAAAKAVFSGNPDDNHPKQASRNSKAHVPVTAGHDHVHMRMVGERRSPSVQHSRHADPGAEMAGVGGNGEHGLGRRLEQKVVNFRLVLPGNRRQSPPAA